MRKQQSVSARTCVDHAAQDSRTAVKFTTVGRATSVAVTAIVLGVCLLRQGYRVAIGSKERDGQKAFIGI